MANKFKYIWVTADGVSLSIPKKLKDEGETVYAVFASDWKQYTGWNPQDDKDREKLMLKRFKGLLDVKTVNAIISAAASIKNPDAYRVICDTNALYPVADKFRKLGFKGLLPTKDDYELEGDRMKAKEMVAKLYKDLETTDSQEFKTVDEVKEFLDEDENKEKFFVAKGNSEDTSAIVPSVTNPEWNHNEIIISLGQDPEYEKGGIVLEEKIMDIVEFCPEAISYDGKIVGVNIDIENKPIGAGNEGFQTGDSSSVSFWITKRGEIYEKFLKPMEKQMLRKGELTYWDANVAYSPSRDTYYFLEYCPNRMGYSAIWNELATMPSVSEYYERIFSGEEVYQADVKKFGTSIRIFNLKEKKDNVVQMEENENIWLIDTYKKDDNVMVCGFDENVAVITGSGESLEQSFYDNFENLKEFGYSQGYHRPLHDVLSNAYESSIPNRYNFLKQLFPELSSEQAVDN